MQPIADWLERLGLGQYAQRFAENDISFSILPDLTDQDLRELGLSMGHRRQLLRAIGGFKNTLAAHAPFTELSSAPPTAPAPAPTLASGASPTGAATGAPVAEASGERRHVTVMFCDLVDFDRHRRATRCGGMARSGWSLSRRRFGGGRGNGRQGRQEARRRADGAVRLSGGSGE